MLVIEKMFKIKVNENSLTKDLCDLLANCHCFDKDKCEVNDSLDCDECLFFDKDGKCQSRIFDWLMSECETKPVEKYRNACGSCKYFEQAEITNKVWRKCPTVYKRGIHAGERRPCSASLQKCCDYVRKEGSDDNV